MSMPAISAVETALEAQRVGPPQTRTSGIGWALGIGRLGGIAAAPLGGLLLAHGFAPRHVFLSTCLFAIVAAEVAS